MREKALAITGTILSLGIFMCSGILFMAGFADAANINSSVIVGNAAPVVSAVSLNGAASIVLTANTTTAVLVNYTVSDANGCGDVFFLGNVTSSVYRTSLGGLCTASNLNCYISNTVTTHDCPSPTSTQNSANATTTFDIFYFAQATDASSSFPSDTWTASVFARDQTGATSTTSSTIQEVVTLNAINVTTSSINYGTVPAGTNTGATNQIATTTNAGNSSTTLQLHAQSTLTSGSNSISTSSQHYSTSTFTYAGTSTALTASPVTVTSFFLTSPTSTTNVFGMTYWGLDVPGGTATGTYSGVTVFGALFRP